MQAFFFLKKKVREWQKPAWTQRSSRLTWLSLTICEIKDPKTSSDRKYLLSRSRHTTCLFFLNLVVRCVRFVVLYAISTLILPPLSPRC